MRCCSSAEERSADSTSETRRKAGEGGGGSALTDDHTPESSKACWENRLERWLLRTLPVGVLSSLPGWRTLPGPPHFLRFWISVCPTFLPLRAKPQACPGNAPVSTETPSRPSQKNVPPLFLLGGRRSCPEVWENRKVEAASPKQPFCK